MEPWTVVAILQRSAGNETVGTMWQETKVFDPDAKLIDVLLWAAKQAHCGIETDAELFRGNLQLAIGQ